MVWILEGIVLCDLMDCGLVRGGLDQLWLVTRFRSDLGPRCSVLIDIRLGIGLGRLQRQRLGHNKRVMAEKAMHGIVSQTQGKIQAMNASIFRQSSML